MKIAIVVPPWIKLPPERYGGIEAVVSILAEGLVARGHSVTLYTIKPTESKATVKYLFEDEKVSYLGKEVSRFLNVACSHALWAYKDIANGDYDIVHDNTWKEGLLSALFIHTPVVHTIHSPFDDENRLFYSIFEGESHINFVTISEFHQRQMPGLNYAGVVYNGIDVKRYPFNSDKDDYFLYLGRFNADKAPHIACKFAREMGFKLLLAGKINEGQEREYFETHVKPYLGDNIRYLGEVSEERKMELFSRAKGYLFPIQWDEPFGITMAEALACGTPVITFRRGAAPEVVAHGVTGFVVDTMDEFAKAIKHVEDISPEDCRARAERMFSSDAMVNGYENIFKHVLEH